MNLTCETCGGHKQMTGVNRWKCEKCGAYEFAPIPKPESEGVNGRIPGVPPEDPCVANICFYLHQRGYSLAPVDGMEIEKIVKHFASAAVEREQFRNFTQQVCKNVTQDDPQEQITALQSSLATSKEVASANLVLAVERETELKAARELMGKLVFALEHSFQTSHENKMAAQEALTAFAQSPALRGERGGEEKDL